MSGTLLVVRRTLDADDSLIWCQDKFLNAKAAVILIARRCCVANAEQRITQVIPHLHTVAADGLCVVHHFHFFNLTWCYDHRILEIRLEGGVRRIERRAATILQNELDGNS